MEPSKRPLDAALASSGIPELVEILAERLAGAELTTILLEVMRRRAGRAHPADVLRRYESNRFVGPAELGLDEIRRAEDLFLGEVPPEFDRLLLSPVAPLGTHSVVAAVDQNNIVSTMRGTEVAADATNGLALEAIKRRRDLLAIEPKTAALVRLVTVQRVVRAQRFERPDAFAHFGLLAAVTAGRDTGDRQFERVAVLEHLRFMTGAVLSAGADTVRVDFADFTDGAWGAVIGEAASSLAKVPLVEVSTTPSPAPGAAYYDGLRFQLYAGQGDATVHLGDGGLVDWSRRTLSNCKERLLISGIGVDRLAGIQAGR